jgi:hypothetical protein
MVAVLAEMIALFRHANLQRTSFCIRTLFRGTDGYPIRNIDVLLEKSHEVLVEHLKNLRQLYLNQLQMFLSAEEQIAIASLDMIDRATDAEMSDPAASSGVS